MKVAVFSRHFLPKTLDKKGKKCKGGKKSKKRMTVASVDGGKVDKPIAIWKSKKTRCFKRRNAASKLKSKFLISKMQSHGCKLI